MRPWCGGPRISQVRLGVGPPDALKTLLDITGGFHGLLGDPAWRIVP